MTTATQKKALRILALSDTHGQHRKVYLSFDYDEADVLVFAGDLMTGGWSRGEVLDFADWLKGIPIEHKVVVAGNHDRIFETNPTWCREVLGPDIHYLVDSSVTIDGYKFHGSPVQPWFHSWAFNVPRGPAIKEHWDKIPDDTDVLITHGPPYGILDQMIPGGPGQHRIIQDNRIFLPTEHLGCEELRKAVDRIRPAVSIFGHIHGSYGTDYTHSETEFHNVAICNEAYDAVNLPHLIHLYNVHGGTDREHSDKGTT